MKNYVQPGAAIDVVTPSGGYTAGNFYVVGVLAGVAALTSLEGADNVLHTDGVFTLPKETGQAWAIGDQLYWDAGNSRFTKTAGENISRGVAAAVAASGDTTGNVKIGGAGAGASVGPIAQQAAIADLIAISGGESPTEGEHNAVIAKVNDILAKLRLAGVIEDA